MTYELINEVEANKIKDILLKTPLSSHISISIPQLKLNLEIDSVSETNDSTIFSEMEEVFFMKEDSTKVLIIENKEYELFYNIGEWGTYREIEGGHICLGTKPVTFGSRYFAQVELSQAVKDSDNIYIIKNITKMAGEGAIVRINSGLGTDKIMKLKRRQHLAEGFEGKTIQVFDNEWLCISIIKIKDLDKESKRQLIINQFMESFLRYAFQVESIINDPIISSELTGGVINKTYFSKLTHEQRKKIEMGAMKEVQKHYEKKGYILTDVSLQRGLGYDFYAQRKDQNDLFIEVKGTTVCEDWTIILTASEYDASEKYKNDYHLVVVEFEDINNLKINKFNKFKWPSNNEIVQIRPSEYYVKKRLF